MQDDRISSHYLMAALFISRILVSFTYIAPEGRRLSGTDVAVSSLLAALLCALCFFPAKRLLDGGGNLLTRARRCSPAFARGLAAIYTLGFVFAVFAAMLRFELFAGAVLFPDGRNHWLTGMMLLCAGYGAYKGFRTVSRASAFVGALTAAGLLLILFTLQGKARADYLRPPFSDGVGVVLRRTLTALGSTAEVAAIPVLSEKTDPRIKKTFLPWMFAGFSTLALLALFESAVLGRFGEKELFPAYALTAQATVGSGVRLDAVFTAIWVLCALVKLCLCFTVLCEVFASGFGVKNKLSALIGCGTVSAAAVFLTSGNPDAAKILISPAPLLLFLSMTVAIPLSVRAAEKLRDRRTGAVPAVNVP